MKKKTLLDLEKKEKMRISIQCIFSRIRITAKFTLFGRNFAKKVCNTSNNVLCHQKWISQPKNRENQSVKSILTEKIVVKVKKSSYSNYMLLFYYSCNFGRTCTDVRRNTTTCK